MSRRFIYDEFEDCIIDNLTGKTHWGLDDTLNNKLNTLHEENIQYKQELDNIYLLIGRGDWRGLVDLIKGDLE